MFSKESTSPNNKTAPHIKDFLYNTKHNNFHVFWYFKLHMFWYFKFHVFWYVMNLSILIPIIGSINYIKDIIEYLL